jgi:hypothetical protein
LSDRIDGLVKALRVRGVYDASQPALQRLLTEGDNNTLVPVDNWMAFGEKGGLKGAIDLLPIDMLAATLNQCYQARADIKNQIYEITGLSDILRGASFASETATAQQIKGQFASLRLRAMQEDVALFASELLRLKAQIICTKFQPQTILSYAAAGQMQPADQQMIPQALELIKDRPLRNFRIEVAADSLVQLDEAQMKQDRVEFITAFGGFLREALPVAQASPEITPMLVEVMKFGVSAFKQSKPIEGALDAALDQLKQKQQQAAMNPQQKPDPEMMKLQAQQQSDQMRVQADVQAAQAKAQLDAQLAQAKMQSDAALKQMELEAEARLEAQKQQFEAQMAAEKLAREEEFQRWKTELEAATKVTVARISSNPGVDIPLVEAATASAERMTQELGAGVQSALEGVEMLHRGMADTAQKMETMMQVMSAPKRIIRGPDGKAIGVEIQTQ